MSVMKKIKCSEYSPLGYIQSTLVFSYITVGQKAKAFVHGRPVQPLLMFASKAGSLPKSGIPKRCFKLVGSRLAPNHYTRLEMLSRQKRSILIGTFINYSLKKF
jgi:hypothetical protein